MLVLETNSNLRSMILYSTAGTREASVVNIMNSENRLNSDELKWLTRSSSRWEDGDPVKSIKTEPCFMLDFDKEYLKRESKTPKKQGLQ